jgi:hypothetical protein
MSTYPETSGPSTGSAEIGPPPYYHRSDCNICRKQDGLKTGAELLDAPIPGGYVVEGEHFLVEHAPLQESSAGTVILEARRHLLDFGEMTPTESAELGKAIASAWRSSAISRIVGCEPAEDVVGDGCVHADSAAQPSIR